MIMYDGLGSNMMKFDLTTFAILSQVPMGSLGVTTFGVRPTATDPENEVWTAFTAVNGAGAVAAGGITIVDLATNSVAASIPNTANIAPVNIVFTNSGNTALEAVSYPKPDSLGNNGAILVFDAVSRTLTSTLPLKNAPQQILMAPDGLTAYILGSNFTITYYDVLSGTADLTAQFPLAFVTGSVFLHPDGTRIFVDQGYGLGVFDLTTRQITNTFNYNLAMYAISISVNMSQDGSTVWVTDSLNNVTILDTRYGNIVAIFPTAPKSMIFPGPAY
jgi:WD40 repeat protein